MKHPISITPGMQFGAMTAIRLVPKLERTIKSNQRVWLCKCSCGTVKQVAAFNLKRGSVKSCGCGAGIIRIKHGCASSRAGTQETREYSAWRGMRHRCYNPHHRNRHWCGRGITICDRWNDFSNFLLDMGKAPAGTSIDRIDTNGNYEPGNCRWATQLQQQRNRRNSQMVSHNGKSKFLCEWASDAGMAYITLMSRLSQLGWDFEKAITTPVRKTKIRHQNN